MKLLTDLAENVLKILEEKGIEIKQIQQNTWSKNEDVYKVELRANTGTIPRPYQWFRNMKITMEKV